MSIRQACAFYDISKVTLQNWLKDSSIKLTRNKPPSKMTPAVKSVDLNLGGFNQTVG